MLGPGTIASVRLALWFAATASPPADAGEGVRVEISYSPTAGRSTNPIGTNIPRRSEVDYTFEGHAGFLDQLVVAKQLDRYAIYLHDHGSQFGLRLAMRAPERVAALIIQNGDIYEDEHGPKCKALKGFWSNPSDEGRALLAANASEDGFRDEFAGELRKYQPPT